MRKRKKSEIYEIADAYLLVPQLILKPVRAYGENKCWFFSFTLISPSCKQNVDQIYETADTYLLDVLLILFAS